MQTTLTADIKPEWAGVHGAITKSVLNIVRRLQSEAHTEGCAILTIRVAVNADGNPICWSKPEVVKLEPKASCHVDELLAALTK